MLNIPLSPSKLDICNFSLLSENESDRVSSNANVQLVELKAQLDIINEDRQRLKKDNEKLKGEPNTGAGKAFLVQAELQKQIENDRIIGLQQEISKLRKECEEKDKLLNAMRTLLGGTLDPRKKVKDCKENKTRVNASPVSVSYNQTRLPNKKKGFKQNRSISPISYNV